MIPIPDITAGIRKKEALKQILKWKLSHLRWQGWNIVANSHSVDPDFSPGGVSPEEDLHGD